MFGNFNSRNFNKVNFNGSIISSMSRVILKIIRKTLYVTRYLNIKKYIKR